MEGQVLQVADRRRKAVIRGLVLGFPTQRIKESQLEGALLVRCQGPRLEQGWIGTGPVWKSIAVDKFPLF
jgi:hypothetical protein